MRGDKSNTSVGLKSNIILILMITKNMVSGNLGKIFLNLISSQRLIIINVRSILKDTRICSSSQNSNVNNTILCYVSFS